MMLLPWAFFPGCVRHVGRAGLLAPRMIETGAWVLVDVVRQHRPDLPCMFVGDGHSHLAEWHGPIERAYAHMLRRGLALLTHF